jgi:hypothetical protein
MNFTVKPGSTRHGTILSELKQRMNSAKSKNRDRIDKWEHQEKMAQGVVKLSELEKKAVRTQQQKYITVQVPYSYGMMMSAHTYFASVFLSRTPVFQFEGRHGEPEQNVMAMEALARYQLQVGGMTYPLFIWLYDAAKYGLGVVGMYWDEINGYVSEIVEEPKKYLGIEIPGSTQKKRVSRKVTKYQGNSLYNVQPVKFFWDPSVTPANLQRGEFCGRHYTMGWTEYWQGYKEGKYINAEQAEQYFGMTDPDAYHNTALELPDQYNQTTTKTNRGFGAFVDIFVRLIPSRWGLGSSEMPELWIFTILHQSVIVQCRPMGSDADVFPFFTLETEIEGYALYRPGVMEQQQSFNDILSWLFNSHFYNVEMALNNQFVYDPAKVRMEDVLDPQPGKRIRLKPGFEGTDVKAAIGQLAVYDVTGTHMTDFDKVGQLMQRASGVADGVMGMVNPGGRKTATEVRTSTQGAVNRLKTLSEYMSAQGWTPLSQYLVANTQQFYSAEMKLRIAGDSIGSPEFLMVTPDSIAGSYDFIPVDGNMPIDRFAQAQLYQELITGIAQNPMLAQQFDFSKMVSYVAKLFGMKNVDQFRLETVAPEQIQQDLQAGNVIPATGAPQ